MVSMWRHFTRGLVMILVGVNVIGPVQEAADMMPSEETPAVTQQHPFLPPHEHKDRDVKGGPAKEWYQPAHIESALQLAVGPKWVQVTHSATSLQPVPGFSHTIARMLSEPSPGAVPVPLDLFLPGLALIFLVAAIALHARFPRCYTAVDDSKKGEMAPAGLS